MTSLQQTNTDDGLLHSSTQQITNLTIADNRDTLEELTRDSLYPGANTSVHTLNEEQWTLLKMCSRPTLLSSFEWKSDTSTPLADYTLPVTALGSSNYWYQLFQTFSFAKFDMNIRVQINSTKFHTGRLALVWNPMSSFAPPTGGIKTTVWSATSLPHSILDASMSNSAELVIPFQHYYSYMPLVSDLAESSHALGTLTIENLTGLQFMSPTTPTVRGQIWFWFSNIELYVPIAAHFPFGKIVPQSGVIEQKMILAEKLGRRAATLIGAGKDVVGTGRELFGLADSPTDPLPQNKVMMSNGPTAHGRGVSSAIRLALDPVSCLATKPADIATTVDEMDLNNIIKKSALVEIKDVTTQAFELSISVDPMYCYEEASVTYPTFLSYVARKFAFWRGPLKYRFEFVCSNFHTGRFIASFIPNCTTFQGSTETMANCPSIIMDLQEKRTFEFVVPYVSQQPYKALQDFISQASNFKNRCSTGILQIRNLNNITYPGNVSPFCQLWIYVSAADDFELAVPNNKAGKKTNNYMVKDDDPFDEPITKMKYSDLKIEAQSQFLSTENSEPQEEVPILGNTKAISLHDPSLYGENFMHLSNYLARQSSSFRFDFNNIHRWIFEMPMGTDLQLKTRNGQYPFRDNIVWFSKLFTFWRGSIRVASLNNFGRTIHGQMLGIADPVKLETDIAYPYVFDLATAPIYDSLSGNAFQFANTPMSPVMELEAPYYTQFQNMLNRGPIAGKENFYPDNRDARFLGALNLLYDIGKPETNLNFRFSGIITRSIGPDFHFSFVGRPPFIPFEN